MQWIYTKHVDGIQFVPVTYPFNRPDGILINNLELQRLIDYINERNTQKAFIQGMSDFEFLRQCPSLEYLSIELQLPFREYGELQVRGKNLIKKYNLDCLYDLPGLKSISIYNNEMPDIKPELQLDLERLTELQKYSGEYAFISNTDNPSLKCLALNGYKERNLNKLVGLKNLETIDLTSSKLGSLDGCEALSRLQCLYLYYNRALKDIHALDAVRNSLKALRIVNCPKIEDFSVLGELENLELLHLYGKNVLPSLDFIKKMKNLKTFIFYMPVLDGDLSPCLNLSYVHSGIDRRHYNIKDKDLPKNHYVWGNEDLEEWIRLE